MSEWRWSRLKGWPSGGELDETGKLSLLITSLLSTCSLKEELQNSEHNLCYSSSSICIVALVLSCQLSSLFLYLCFHFFQLPGGPRSDPIPELLILTALQQSKEEAAADIVFEIVVG